jgi:hypothetical protein
MRSLVLLLFLVAEASLFAQTAPYPEGYPPGQRPYPGSPGGIPSPWPRRGKQSGPDTKGPAEPLSTFSGTLRKLDEKSLVVEAGDGRVFDCRRSDKTKFYKNSQEIAASDLESGDRVSVEARQDQQGYLYAVNVYLDKSAATATVETSTPAPARDPEDPGPPTLRRGIPPKRPSSSAQEEPPAAAAPIRPPDPFIEKARAAAESFSEKLPNYVCKEFMARFASSTHPADWRALDVVSSDLVYEDGRESYRNLAINGKAIKKAMEQLDGAWSTGEFGTMLRDVLSPATAADFRFSRESSVAGVRARVYSFQVERLNSHWHVQIASQSINPAYKGSIWIDPKNARVLRIEMQARALPVEFPADTVESAVDYEYIRIGAGEFLLPVHAEGLSCQRGTSNCSRNTIDFRNYHKYEADSSVTFENPAQKKP